MAKFKHVGACPVITPDGREIGRQSDRTVVQGTVFESSWSEDVVAFLVKIGAIEVVEEDTPEPKSYDAPAFPAFPSASEE